MNKSTFLVYNPATGFFLHSLGLRDDTPRGLAWPWMPAPAGWKDEMAQTHKVADPGAEVPVIALIADTIVWNDATKVLSGLPIPCVVIFDMIPSFEPEVVEVDDGVLELAGFAPAGNYRVKVQTTVGLYEREIVL